MPGSLIGLDAGAGAGFMRNYILRCVCVLFNSWNELVASSWMWSDSSGVFLSGWYCGMFLPFQYVSVLCVSSSYP